MALLRSPSKNESEMSRAMMIGEVGGKVKGHRKAQRASSARAANMRPNYEWPVCEQQWVGVGTRDADAYRRARAQYGH